MRRTALILSLESPRVASTNGCFKISAPCRGIALRKEAEQR